MYEYFKAYVIRTGTDGISGEKLRQLYLAVGGINDFLPNWQNEKFEIALKNSAWAFTVWKENDLIGLVRIVSDKIMFASIHDLMVKGEHRKKGIGRKLIQLCLQKLPHGTWTAHTTPENYRFYSECGFDLPTDIINSASLSYAGFRKAINDGHK